MGVILGHHQAAGSGQVDVLLPLRHPGHLQPLCRRLDGGQPGGAPWPEVDPRNLPERRHCCRATDRAYRPGFVDDLQAGGLVTGQPWESPKRTAGLTLSNDNPFSESPTSKRSSTGPSSPDRFGSIQDARFSANSSSPGTTPSIIIPPSGWLTPQIVHYGQAAEVPAARQKVLDQAFQTQSGTLRSQNTAVTQDCLIKSGSTLRNRGGRVIDRYTKFFRQVSQNH